MIWEPQRNTLVLFILTLLSGCSNAFQSPPSVTAGLTKGIVVGTSGKSSYMVDLATVFRPAKNSVSFLAAFGEEAGELNRCAVGGQPRAIR